MLNKKFELVNKCRHQNKLLLSNVRRNDTMDWENCILYVYCSLSEDFFFARTIAILEPVNWFVMQMACLVSVCDGSLVGGIAEQTLVFLLLFILGKQNM